MQSQLVDLYRASIRSATDMMKLSLEQTERLQQQQFQLLRTALDESTRSGNQAGEAKTLDDMVALQSRLASAQLERMTEFWANWWRAAGDAQKTMIEQMQSQMGQARERVREGYAFTARASEEAARLAAAQLSGVVGLQREGAAVQESKAHRKSA
jgi:phasin family protein